MSHKVYTWMSHEFYVWTSYTIYRWMSHEFYLWVNYELYLWMRHGLSYSEDEMCITTHSHVWHVSFLCVTCLISMRDTTHSYVCRDDDMCVMTYLRVRPPPFWFTWPIYMRDTIHSTSDRTHSYEWATHSNVCHVSFIWVTSLIHTRTWIHMNESCQTYEWDMLHTW